MTALAKALSRLPRAALEYARRGWVLIPLHTAPQGHCSCGLPTCPSPGKHPRTSHGLLEASADPATVERWWTQWPDANIGCKPGASGYVVLDLDGPDGEATAQAAGLLAEPTLEVQTGRGRHRWYRHPGGHIPNGTLGVKLDVRGDAGYVLLPPSVHASGAVYRWLGRIDEVAALPPAIVVRIQGVPGEGGAGPRGDKLPAWMIPWLTVQPGERNNTMTRFVGWAYRQGHDAPTVLVMALGLNTQWAQPLEPREVEAICRSIGAREATRPQRRTDTGVVLRTVDEAPVTEPPPSLHALAYDQIEAAIELGRQEYTGSPRWCWSELDRLVGMMLPGDFVIVGALTGNGKTACLMSQMQAWASADTTVLYVPLELDPPVLRRQWAAWLLGLDWVTVARNQWADLPPGAQAEHEQMLAKQLANPHVHFPPDRRITLTNLATWIERAVREVGAQAVIIDHFHRLDFGAVGANYRVQVTEAARALKDLARRHGVVIVAAAQLNQDPHPLDRYYPPGLKRLKESAGISEEANVVLMLSRRLRTDVDTATIASIRAGQQQVRALEEPNVMVVTCRKHRLDDHARDRSIRLAVRDGRVTNLARYFPESVPARWEPT